MITHQLDSYYSTGELLENKKKLPAVTKIKVYKDIRKEGASLLHTTVQKRNDTN